MWINIITDKKLKRLLDKAREGGKESNRIWTSRIMSALLKENKRLMDRLSMLSRKR
jgi:hypothetical protein